MIYWEAVVKYEVNYYCDDQGICIYTSHLYIFLFVWNDLERFVCNL